MLAAFLCGMLAVVIAMTANVGKLVTEKIAMQNAVDLSAFSGASTQALYLNKMRRINDQIWQIARQARTDVGQYDASCHSGMSGSSITPNGPCQAAFWDHSADGPLCSVRAAAGPLMGAQATAGQWASQYQTAINQAKNTFDQLNKTGYNRAHANAQLAVGENYNGLQSKFGWAEGQSQNGGMVDTQQSIVNLSYHAFCYNGITDAVTVSPYTVNFQIPGNNGDGLMAWLWKVEDGDVLFASKVEGAHPVDRFMDFPNPYFMRSNDPCWDAGGNATPNNIGRCGMNLYAAAAPYYGKLGSQDRGNGHGDRWNDYNPMQIEKDSKLDKDRPENGACGANPPSNVYCDYRVRFIGLFEDDLDYVRTSQQASIGSSFVPTQWRPLMRH